MDFLKKLFRPCSIPFFKKQGNKKYSELLELKGIPEGGKYATKRIIQEIHLENEIVVSKLDWNLDYLHINKYGLIREFDLSKSKYERSSKKLFARCDESLTEIMEFGMPESVFLNENLWRASQAPYL